MRGFTLIIKGEVAFWATTRPARIGKGNSSSTGNGAIDGAATFDALDLSPFAKEGQFDEVHAKHHGDNDSRVLCWQAISTVRRKVAQIKERPLFPDSQATSRFNRSSA